MSSMFFDARPMDPRSLGQVKPLPAAQQVKLAAQLCGLSAEHKVLNGLMLGLALAVFRWMVFLFPELNANPSRKEHNPPPILVPNANVDCVNAMAPWREWVVWAGQ